MHAGVRRHERGEHQQAARPVHLRAHARRLTRRRGGRGTRSPEVGPGDGAHDRTPASCPAARQASPGSTSSWTLMHSQPPLRQTFLHPRMRVHDERDRGLPDPAALENPVDGLVVGARQQGEHRALRIGGDRCAHRILLPSSSRTAARLVRKRLRAASALPALADRLDLPAPPTPRSRRGSPTRRGARRATRACARPTRTTRCAAIGGQTSPGSSSASGYPLGRVSTTMRASGWLRCSSCRTISWPWRADARQCTRRRASPGRYSRVERSSSLPVTRRCTSCAEPSPSASDRAAGRQLRRRRAPR